MSTNCSNRPTRTTTYFLGRPATKWQAGLRKPKRRPTRQD
jgi:hypothetical protein